MIKQRGFERVEEQKKQTLLSEPTDPSGLEGKDGVADGGIKRGKDGWLKSVRLKKRKKEKKSVYFVS